MRPALRGALQRVLAGTEVRLPDRIRADLPPGPDPLVPGSEADLLLARSPVPRRAERRHGVAERVARRRRKDDAGGGRQGQRDQRPVLPK